MKSPILIILLGGLTVTGCDSQPAAPPLAKPQTVEVVPVASAVMESTVSLPAQLQPYENVDLFPKVAAFIQDVLVDRGAEVRKGQVLVRLNAPELAAQREQVAGVLRAAEAKAAADKATYERLANAARTPGVVAENDVNIARQTAVADAALVASARESLRNVAQQEAYLLIRAPFDGVVTDRNLHPGALVGPSTGALGARPILQMANVKRLRLVVAVPAADVQGVSVGQTATFTAPSVPGRKFDAPIARIAQALDNRTRTMAIELDVPNPAGTLTAGEFVTVKWPVKRRAPTLQVPQTAIANDQQRQFVVRVTGGVTQWVDVTTGLTADGKTEVFGELRPGDRIVKRGSDALQDGVRVATKASS